MKMNNFIQRIKENIKVLYILSLIFVGFAFYWIFLIPWQSDKDAAIEYLEDLWEKDPAEELRILNELRSIRKSRRKLSIFKDLKIDMKGESPLGISVNEFKDIYCINKDIYVVGGYPAVILRLQKDGKWERKKIENLEGLDRSRLFGIWGNNEKGIFAVGIGDFSIGGGGIILRSQGEGNWIGKGIRRIGSKNVRSLSGIWGNNEKGIFAVGYGGVILRSQGDGNWKREDIKSKDVRRLSGIWGNNEKGIFVVGIASDGEVILRSQGDGNWKREDIKSKDVRKLSGIWGNNEKG
jgi:hypothetical protein